MLVLDGDRRLRIGLGSQLRKRGFTVETVADAQEAIRTLTARSFDVIFCDVASAGVNAEELLHEIHGRRPDASIVLMISATNVPEAVAALLGPADGCLVKPVAPSEVGLLVARILDARTPRREILVAAQPSLEPSPLFESANATMQRAIATARRVAASDAPVLLVGESGTGKNVLAAAIHAWSRRASEPFFIVPCTTLAALPLAEKTRGTLFFDEVGDLPPSLQGRVLQLFAEQGFERAGAATAIARIIAATNRKLDAEVQTGKFRKDLFFRLSVITIVLPPLRDRPEDVPPLANHTLARLATRHGRGSLTLSREVSDIFAAYRWPGNVRELVNTLERAVVLSTGGIIYTEHLPDHILAPAPAAVDTAPSISLSLEELERQQIERVLRDSGTLDEAAGRLGINPATLWRKRKRYGLHR
jgi:two-component system, NtrC family, response regulator AlgB